MPLRSRVVRDEPLRALSIACAETGPWNVVALAEPFTGSTSEMLKQLLIEIAGATGLVLVGPRARRTTGPAIVAVEDIDHLPSMLKAPSVCRARRPRSSCCWSLDDELA